MAKAFELPQLNLQDLKRRTPDPVKDRSGKCRILASQYSAGSRNGFQRTRPKYPTFYNEQRVYTKCTTEKRYSYIRFYGPPSEQSPVWVWCNCEYFGYYVEWVLTQYGSSSLHPGYQDRGPQILNRPPRIRNPGRVPHLCKHLVLCAKVGLSQTRDLAAKYAEPTIEDGVEIVEENTGRKKASRLHVPNDMMELT